MVEQNDIIPQ